MSNDEQSENDAEEEVTVNDDIDIDDTPAAMNATTSLLSKDRERQKLHADIEAFLASGGKIQTVDSNVVGDPPKKPQASYGSQPI